MSNLYHNTSLLLQTTYNSIHRHYSTGIEIIRRNVRPFLILQAGYWSLALMGVAITYRYPEIQQKVLDSTNKDLDRYQVGRWVKAAYDDGHVLKAAGWTFLINLTIGSFGCITLPSMIVPTSGILMAGVRAMTWGLIFSPIAGKKDALTLPHFITMLIEAQPYILAALGDWFLTRRFISQFGWTRVEGEGQIRSIDNEENKDKKGKRTIWSWIPISWSGYGQGLKDVLSLYGPITGILAIAAIWEGYEVIHFKKGFW
ncbi:hypothetical protein L486_04291 [Kwoniella mangroviensis CBS 10435]|uniref:Uncharacterized protein n=1 Tax=Kwoniella mangroviensis CBS 10435 TaxID=1331196 RepID=A0A1B9IRU6_9TREE|nr:hypothetical protein L486_04291 [Kwoniella mangroviensis CBS 10435]